MRPTPIALRAAIAFAFAGICVFGEMAGCVAALLLGVVCLAHLPRIQPVEVTRAQRPQLYPFREWGACILLYNFFVLLLSPFASLPAVLVALVLLSPLFGTQVYLAAATVDRLLQQT